MSLHIVNCLVLGDGTVGKTTLLNKLCIGKYHMDYVPTLFDTYEILVAEKSKYYKLRFHDTAGQEDQYQIRKIAMETNEIDIIIICFAVDNPASYENIISQWIPEVTVYGLDGVPKLLVKTKCDLGNSSSDSGQFLSRIIHAEYVEISSFTEDGLQEIIQKIFKLLAAHEQIKSNNSKKSKCCSIL